MGGVAEGEGLEEGPCACSRNANRIVHMACSLNTIVFFEFLQGTTAVFFSTLTSDIRSWSNLDRLVPLAEKNIPCGLERAVASSSDSSSPSSCLHDAIFYTLMAAVALPLISISGYPSLKSGLEVPIILTLHKMQIV